MLVFSEDLKDQLKRNLVKLWFYTVKERLEIDLSMDYHSLEKSIPQLSFLVKLKEDTIQGFARYTYGSLADYFHIEIEPYGQIEIKATIDMICEKLQTNNVDVYIKQFSNLQYTGLIGDPIHTFHEMIAKVKEVSINENYNRTLEKLGLNSRIVTPIQLLDEDMEAFTSLYSQMKKDAPTINKYMPTIPFTVDGMKRRLAKVPFQLYIILLLEENIPVAFTELRFKPGFGNICFHGNTGVKRSYRGKGLSYIIKSISYTFLRDNFPFIEYWHTTNSESNRAMLSTNRKLGHQSINKIHYRWIGSNEKHL